MDKVRKDQLFTLLSKIKNLAEHPNTPENEAAAAMLKFRSLLLKYNIHEEEVSDGLHLHDYEAQEVIERARIHPWQSALATIIAPFCGCVYVSARFYRKRRRYSISFYGSHADIIYAKYLYESISTGFTRASNSAWADFVSHKWTGYHYKEYQYKREFLSGCVYGLAHKIDLLEKENTAYAEDKALVLSKFTAVSDYLEREKNISTAEPTTLKSDLSQAFYDGVDTGKKANLNPPISQDTQSLIV